MPRASERIHISLVGACIKVRNLIRLYAVPMEKKIIIIIRRRRKDFYSVICQPYEQAHGDLQMRLIITTTITFEIERN